MDATNPRPVSRKGKNRPIETKWKQQNLAAYRPVFNATTVFPWTTVLGIFFVAIGILLYVTMMKAKEVVIDYTNCRDPNGTNANDIVVRKAFSQVMCKYEIELAHEMNGTVKFFYGLDGFYQNSRLYVKSRNDMQLVGKLNKTEDCDPFDKDTTTSADGHNITLSIAPCGRMADSIFNDTFELLFKEPLTGVQSLVPLTTRDMLHEWEQERKFKNPEIKPGETLCDAFRGTVRPKSWPVDACEFGANDTKKGFESIDFQVWMKPAALPKFRKIYRILDREADIFKHGLPAGNYTLKINYHYPVESLSINKTFIIAVESWAGPRNLFLPVAYIVVGGLLLVISALLCGLHIRMRYKSE